VAYPKSSYIRALRRNAAFPVTVDPWIQQQKLTASDGAAGDFFGVSVSVSGDTAVIGASYHAVGGNIQQGAAYVFVRSGGVWSQQQELTASDGTIFDNSTGKPLVRPVRLEEV